MTRNGSVPQTPASTGEITNDRKHLARHVHDDGVRIAVRHDARPGTPARHPEAAGVVDDDQVGAAGLRALRPRSGAGSGADDRVPCCDRLCAGVPAPPARFTGRPGRQIDR